MGKFQPFVAESVIPATSVNGRASEAHACTFAKQERILDISLDEVGDKLPLVCGSLPMEVRTQHVSPKWRNNAVPRRCLSCSQCFGMGAQLRPEMPIAHFKRIADASDLPLICFQYSL